MMTRVLGAPPRLKPWIPHIMEFCDQQLLSRQMSRHVTTTLTWKKKFEGEYEGCIAWCVEKDQSPHRDFEIAFNPEFPDLRLRVFLSTVCHEMTHLAQKATGRFVQKYNRKINDYEYYWEGKKYDADYWDLPWEREAYGTEVCLYSKFAEVHKSLKKYKPKLQNASAKYHTP